MVTGREVAWASLTLGAWWALWSLGDAYLLRYTPWSELAILGAALLLYAVATCCKAGCLRIQECRAQRYARRPPPVADSLELHGDVTTTAAAGDALIG